MTEARVPILRVYSRLEVGGIEYQLLRVLPLLNRGRYFASLCLLKRGGEMAEWLRAGGVDVQVIPFPSRVHPGSIRALAALMRRKGIRIVHAHVRESNTSALVAARLARVPVVIGSIHNMDTITKRRHVFQERLLARWRDHTVAVSERVRRNYCETIGVPPEKTSVIYNGLDPSPFDALAQSNPELVASLGVPPGERIVVCVARLNSNKRHEDLLVAAARVLRKAPHTTFLMIGEGALREALRVRAAEMGLGHKVIFAGKRDDVPAILRVSHVFALSSVREGFSNAVLESLAAGLPAVVTDVGGNAEAIEEGVSGFLVGVGDVDAIEDRLLRLLTDEPLRLRFAAAARRRVERFSLAESVRSTEALYDRLFRAMGIDPGEGARDLGEPAARAAPDGAEAP